MQWIQNYNPLGNIWLSALVACLPIVLFFLSLVIFKLKGHIAGALTVILTAIIALFVYKMPFAMMLSSFVYGFLYGLWPIAWIIISAIFLYKLTVKSGYFDILRESILSITPDLRLQVVLIGFCFGAFLEGAIGFGAPVAITAALLVGLGLKPLYSAGLCMIANTAPVAFGSVGIPIIALSELVSVPAIEISAMTGRILLVLASIVPFFIVYLMDGMKGVRETFPAVLVTTIVFALVQFLTSNYVGAELPSIASSICAIVALTIFLKFWKVKKPYIAVDKNHNPTETARAAIAHSRGKVFLAWAPFILLVLILIVWTQPFFKGLFQDGSAFAFSTLSIPFTSINGHIVQTTPVVSQDTPVKAIFSLPIINTVGSAILLTALITVAMLKVKTATALKTFGETLREMRFAILTIGLVLAFAYLSNYSGLSATLALALANTGKAFTFFSPIIGWLGVFITGSDTSSNLLFGTLQQLTAQQIHIPANLFLAANSAGGVVGKMISPQSIAVACAAVGIVGKESELFRFTIKYSILFLILVGILTTLIAFVLPWVIV